MAEETKTPEVYEFSLRLAGREFVDIHLHELPDAYWQILAQFLSDKTGYDKEEILQILTEGEKEIHDNIRSHFAEFAADIINDVFSKAIKERKHKKGEKRWQLLNGQLRRITPYLTGFTHLPGVNSQCREGEANVHSDFLSISHMEKETSADKVAQVIHAMIQSGEPVTQEKVALKLRSGLRGEDEGARILTTQINRAGFTWDDVKNGFFTVLRGTGSDGKNVPGESKRKQVKRDVGKETKTEPPEDDG
jgi:hypothetical protein